MKAYTVYKQGLPLEDESGDFRANLIAVGQVQASPADAMTAAKELTPKPVLEEIDSAWTTRTMH